MKYLSNPSIVHRSFDALLSIFRYSLTSNTGNIHYWMNNVFSIVNIQRSINFRLGLQLSLPNRKLPRFLTEHFDSRDTRCLPLANENIKVPKIVDFLADEISTKSGWYLNSASVGDAMCFGLLKSALPFLWNRNVSIVFAFAAYVINDCCGVFNYWMWDVKWLFVYGSKLWAEILLFLNFFILSFFFFFFWVRNINEFFQQFWDNWK